MGSESIKVLFATRTSPFAGDAGSGAYAFDVLSHLRRNGFNLHVAWTEPPDLNPTRGWYHPPENAQDVFSLSIMGMTKLGRGYWRPSVVWLPLKARALHSAKQGLRSAGIWRERRSTNPASAPAVLDAPAASPSWGDGPTSEEVNFIRSEIDRHQPDVVLANYSWMVPAACPAPGDGPPVVALTADVRHRQIRLVDGRAVEVLNEHTTLEQERNQLRGAAALIAIQSTEAAVFARLFPEKQVVTALMAATLRPLPLPTAPAALFVGSGHHANRDGLHWFLNEAWPHVRSAVPDARLLIAGAICDSLTDTLPPGVLTLGRLPDLSTAYAQASVAIAPILQGSGLKIKVIEAISFGRACVTTPIGAEGLENFRPSLHVAETAERFAHDLVSLLRDPALTSTTAASVQALARELLSPRACYGPVVSLLREMAAHSTRPA